METRAVDPTLEIESASAEVTTAVNEITVARVEAVRTASADARILTTTLGEMGMAEARGWGMIINGPVAGREMSCAL